MSNNVVDDCLRMNLPRLECGHTFVSVQAIFCETPHKSKKENKVRSIDEKQEGCREVLDG